MKVEYETLECLDAAPAISSPEFLSEKKYKNFMLHICNMGLNRVKNVRHVTNNKSVTRNRVAQPHVLSWHGSNSGHV